jgi:hypothetical protein
MKGYRIFEEKDLVVDDGKTERQKWLDSLKPEMIVWYYDFASYPSKVKLISKFGLVSWEVQWAESWGGFVAFKDNLFKWKKDIP